MNGWFIRGVCAALLVGVSFPSDTVQAFPQSTPAPALKITPGSITFSPQAVDTVSAPQTISLSNSGSSQLRISDVLVSGIDFAQTSTCGPTLAAGASCTVAVTIKPAIIGPRLGTISIVTSDPGSPRLVPLSGTGE